MLTKKQISEIREHLEKAQNPVFYFDNDADGLCSYVLLRKFLGRGKGVAVRSFPDLNAGYARKARELNADYVFVLDKPVMSEEFAREIDTLGLSLVWIDHHDIAPADFEKEIKNFFVYNPARNTGKEKSEEPVTFWSYKITERKEDEWLAVVGCIADHYLPDFAFEFGKNYPEFWSGKKICDPFDAYYGTEIGRIAQALNFGLKDSITHVVQLQNFLISAGGPSEIFQEVRTNYSFRRKYEDVKKKYDSLLARAAQSVFGNLIFFDYSGDLSISADLSNKLSHSFPDKYIVVAYRNGAAANLSMRGKNVRAVLEKVLKKVEGTGGGHMDAVGARIKTEDLGKFKEVMGEEIGKK